MTLDQAVALLRDVLATSEAHCKEHLHLTAPGLGAGWTRHRAVLDAIRSFLHDTHPNKDPATSSEKER